MSSNMGSNEGEMELTLTSNRSWSWVSFESMFRSESLTDVIITCTDGQLKAHKLVLSAWSTYFRDIFVSNDNHLCQKQYIFMKDIPYNDLKLLIELMYSGRASLSRTQLDSIHKSAKALDICNLIQLDDNNNDNNDNHKRKRDNDMIEVEENVLVELKESEDNQTDKEVNENNESVVSLSVSSDKTDEYSDNNTSIDSNSENNLIVEQIVEKSNISSEESEQNLLLCKESISESLNSKNNIESNDVSKNETQVIERENTTKSLQNLNSIAINDEQNKDSNGSQVEINLTEKRPQFSNNNTNNTGNKTIVRKDKRKSVPTKILYTNRDLNSTIKMGNIRNSNSESYTFSRCLRSSTQLSYEERQQYFKLQQMNCQNLNEPKSTPQTTVTQTEQISCTVNKTVEETASGSDNVSDNENLLIELNTNDVLSHSKDSIIDNEHNKAKKLKKDCIVVGEKVEKLQHKQIPNDVDVNQTKCDTINKNENHINSKATLLTTRHNKESQPLYVYNVVTNPFSPSSSSITIPTNIPTIMYISDPKVAQKVDLNLRSAEKRVISHWASVVKTNSSSKASSLSNSIKMARNASPSANSFTLLSRLGTPLKKKDISLKKSEEKSSHSSKKRNSYQCEKCTKAYSSHQTLVDHHKVVHQKSSENYGCKLCGKTVKWKDSLRSHFKTNHPDIDSTNMIEFL